MSVADRLDSAAQQQEIWCQLLYSAVEKFSRQCEDETENAEFVIIYVSLSTHYIERVCGQDHDC